MYVCMYVCTILHTENGTGQCSFLEIDTIGRCFFSADLAAGFHSLQSRHSSSPYIHWIEADRLQVAKAEYHRHRQVRCPIHAIFAGAVGKEVGKTTVHMQVQYMYT